MGGQPHQSDTRILDRRSLAHDHRRLAALLAPGLRVLDVGCGTGAITRGIAEAVGPGGEGLGVDRDPAMIARAHAHAAALPQLRFAQGDATTLDLEARFDIVTAARTLQWIADLPEAVRRMVRAIAPGGWLVVLDYNHALNAWQPAPPPEVAAFYAAFLSWRAANGWDNEVANHLPALLAAEGLHDIRSYDDDEVAVRGDAGFEQQTSLWGDVIDKLGPALIAAQVCDRALVDGARRAFDGWRASVLQRQALSLKTIVARRYQSSGSGKNSFTRSS